MDLQLSASSDRALAMNRQRRGNSAFSHITLNLFTDIVASDRLTVFNHVVVDPSAHVSINSFLRTWVRYSAVVSDGFDLLLQVGKIPTPFGHFTERAYSDINPVLGYPLMYHYSSSLRSNQLPADNADLLAHRGQGTPEAFSGYDGGGSSGIFAGLPLVYDSCWDFGGSVIGSLWRFEYLVAVTSPCPIHGPTPLTTTTGNSLRPAWAWCPSRACCCACRTLGRHTWTASWPTGWLPAMMWRTSCRKSSASPPSTNGVISPWWANEPPTVGNRPTSSTPPAATATSRSTDSTWRHATSCDRAGLPAAATAACATAGSTTPAVPGAASPGIGTWIASSSARATG